MESEPELKKIAEAMTKHLVDSGKLVEAGWVGLKLGLKLQEASQVQQSEMRWAFFAGAAHVFTSMMSFLEPGSTEPTDKDLKRMDQLADELTRFQQELEARIRKHN